MQIEDEMKAIEHLALSEEVSSKIEDISADTNIRNIGSVGIIGGGTMGGGIAMNFANAGIPAYLLEVSEEAIAKGFNVIKKITCDLWIKGN